MMTAINSNSTNLAGARRAASEALPPPLDEGSRGSWKVVYTIVERGHGKRLWLRIGVAFVNRDGSLNVRLDAVPINGQLHIREALSRDGRDGREGASELFAMERDAAPSR